MALGSSPRKASTRRTFRNKAASPLKPETGLVSPFNNSTARMNKSIDELNNILKSSDQSSNTNDLKDSFTFNETTSTLHLPDTDKDKSTPTTSSTTTTTTSKSGKKQQDTADKDDNNDDYNEDHDHSFNFVSSDNRRHPSIDSTSQISHTSQTSFQQQQQPYYLSVHNNASKQSVNTLKRHSDELNSVIDTANRNSASFNSTDNARSSTSEIYGDYLNPSNNNSQSAESKELSSINENQLAGLNIKKVPLLERHYKQERDEILYNNNQQQQQQQPQQHEKDTHHFQQANKNVLDDSYLFRSSADQKISLSTNSVSAPATVINATHTPTPPELANTARQTIFKSDNDSLYSDNNSIVASPSRERSDNLVPNSPTSEGQESNQLQQTGSVTPNRLRGLSFQSQGRSPLNLRGQFTPTKSDHSLQLSSNDQHVRPSSPLQRQLKVPLLQHPPTSELHLLDSAAAVIANAATAVSAIAPKSGVPSTLTMTPSMSPQVTGSSTTSRSQTPHLDQRNNNKLQASVQKSSSSSSMNKQFDYLYSSIDTTAITLESLIDPISIINKFQDPRIKFIINSNERSELIPLYSVVQPYSRFQQFDNDLRRRGFTTLPEIPSPDVFLKVDPFSWDSKKSIIRMYLSELCRLMRQNKQATDAWKLFTNFFSPNDPDHDMSKREAVFVQLIKTMKKSHKLVRLSFDTIENTLTIYDYTSKSSDIFPCRDCQFSANNQTLTIQKKRKKTLRSNKPLILYAESSYDAGLWEKLLNPLSLNDPHSSPSQQQMMLQPSHQQSNHQAADDQSSHFSSNSLNARSPNMEYDSAISTPSMATQSTNSNHYENSSNNSMKVHSDQLTPTTPNFDHSYSNNSSNSALASSSNNPSSNNLNINSASSVLTSNTGATITSTNNTSTIASITSKPWGLFSKRHNTNSSNNNNNSNNKNNSNADGNTSNISGTGSNYPYSPTRSVQGNNDTFVDSQNASFQTIGNASNSKSNDVLEFKSMAYSDTLPVGSNGTAQLQNHGSAVQLDQLRVQGGSNNDVNTFVRVIEPENRMFGSTLERGLELSPPFTILDKPIEWYDG
ncbi:unnamed protein product [[Candida] boidinii]|nr:unnamed protein product [[Candida] boidinii]